MKIPEGYSEQEVVEILYKVADILKNKFKFGPHSRDDMVQQAVMLGIEGLNNYNPDKGKLENFLMVHIRNRLIIWKRDSYSRYEPPCKSCPLFRPNDHMRPCEEYDNRLDCELYSKWYNRNETKKSICSPENFGDTINDNVAFMDDNHEIEDLMKLEIFKLIEDRIPIEMKADYLRLRDGGKLPRNRHRKLIIVLRDILNERIKPTET